VLSGYVAIYLSVVGEGLKSGSSLGDVIRQTLFRMYVPGIFGGPWHADGAESTIYPYAETFPAILFLTLALATVIASFLVSGARCFEGWALLVGYLTADMMLLSLGRPEWVGLLSRDPRYVADALPITAIAIAAAFRGIEPSFSDRPVAVLLRSRLTLTSVVKASAVVIASCLVTTVRMAPVVQHEYARNFTLGVVREMSDHPDRSVVRSAAPFEISARADLAQMMNAIGQDYVFNRPSTQMYIFDGLANMHRMDLLAGTKVVRGPEPGCGWPVHAQPVSVGILPPTQDPERVLRLGYLSREPAILRVKVDGQTQSLRVPAGVGLAFFVVDDTSGPLVVGMSETDGLCVTDWTVGPPWVAN
jgi:hypothetical protein